MLHFILAQVIKLEDNNETNLNHRQQKKKPKKELRKTKTLRGTQLKQRAHT